MIYSKTLKTLDLNVFIEKLMECKLPDGTMLNIKRPTKAIVLALQALPELAEAPEEEKYSAVKTLCLDILNNNSEKRFFTPADIDGIPEEMLAALMAGYKDFIMQLVNDPN